MSNKNLENIEELKKLILSEDDGYEVYNNLMGLLGIEQEVIDESFVSKINLEYVSETGKELSYAYNSDSGFDIFSSEDIEIGPLGRALVPTGVKFNIPQNYEIQIRSKSGLAINQGLMVLNSPGTIDEGYNGEIKIILFNTNNHPVNISKGMKIGQCVISSCLSGKYVNLVKVDKVPLKDRNNKGFGSTGI